MWLEEAQKPVENVQTNVLIGKIKSWKNKDAFKKTKTVIGNRDWTFCTILLAAELLSVF